MSAEGEHPQSSGAESWPASQPQQPQEQQQHSSWGASRGPEGYSQPSEQAFPAVHSQPEVGGADDYPQATNEHQPMELGSYQQADWNATQWREQQASSAPEYTQAQQQYQPQGDSFQWHQQQQPSTAGYEQHTEVSYDFYSQQQQQSGAQESMVPAGPVITNRASAPFTPSPRTPSFHQPPAAVWGSQIRHQSAADAGLVPGTAAEGTRVAHGRPPCAIIAWGFGGRCALVRPRMQGIAPSNTKQLFFAILLVARNI